MSTTTHHQGREKELQRRRALQTQASIITPDNDEILLTQNSLTTIANKISQIVGRKLQRGEIKTLVQFVRKLPADRYYSLNLIEAQDKIAGQFLTRYQAIANNFSEESDIEVSCIGPCLVSFKPLTCRQQGACPRMQKTGPVQTRLIIQPSHPNTLRSWVNWDPT